MKKSLVPIEIRRFRPGDEQAILDCFNRVFAAVDVTFQPRELSTWRWQFEGNPSGSHIHVAVTPDGTVVGQFAAIVQTMAFDGGTTLFSQGVDHMADPAYRRRFRHGTMLAELGDHFAKAFGGAGPEKVTLMWGAPVPAAWRTGRTSIRYEIVRTQLKLVGTPEELRAGAAPGVDVQEVAAFPEEVEGLFREATAAHRAIALRDKAHLDWRFVDHPQRRYDLALARRGGALTGYAVYGQGDFDHQVGEGQLVDWLVRPGDRETGHALRAWVAERARRASVPRVVTVFPDTVPEWSAFQEAGWRVAPTRYFIIGRQYVRGYDMHWMHRNWYYTLGDTDLA